MRVTDSIGPAWERTKAVLFRPFNLGTWFSFGFVFFLQSCMEGGGGNLNIPNGSGGNSGSGSGGGETDNAISHALGALGPPRMPWADLEPGLVVGIVVAAAVIAIPLILLAYWLGTRGQMMAIQCAAVGRADVGALWSGTRSQANKLLKFHLALAGISLVVFLPVLVVGALLIAPRLSAGEGFESVLGVIVGLAVLVLILVIPFAIVGGMTRNFVAPIMLKYDIGAREAWKRFWAVGRDHVGGIIGFFLLRFVFAIGAGIVGTIAGLLTCCIGLLPVMHQTLMAPYYLFERTWTLEVLASMHPDFDLRNAEAAAPAYPPYGPAGYGPPPGYGPVAPPDNPYAPPGYGGYDPSGGGGGPTGGGAPPGYGPPG